MSAAAGARIGLAGPSIPSNSRKVVQDLKEIVKNSEDEIYAMLKECNMDPNETVQRLLAQDTFHEVKRKRDKKKENVNKESGEARVRPSGFGPVRGGRVPDRGLGRGNYTPCYNSELSGGGRGQNFIGRDNGSYQNAKAASTTTSSSSLQIQAQIKAGSTATSGSNTGVATTSVDSTGVPNGNSTYTRAPQGPRMCWSPSPGHTTMADIVKASNVQKYAATAASISSSTTETLQLTTLSTDVSPGVLSTSTDHILHTYVEPGAVGVKRGVGIVGNQRSIGEQAPVLSMEVGLVSGSLEHPPETLQPSTGGLDVFLTETNVEAAEVDIPSTSVSSSFSQERPTNQIPAIELGGIPDGPSISSGASGASGSRTSIIQNQYNRVVYQTQQHPVGSQKGSGLEWKPKSPVKSTSPSQAVTEAPPAIEASRLSPPVSPQENTCMLLESTSKLEQLSIQDDQPVIIPNHLQVPEADRTHLSFGNFGEDFDTPFPSNFSGEDDIKDLTHVEDNSLNTGATVEQLSASSLMISAPLPLEQNYTNQSTAPPVETLVRNNDVAISILAPTIASAVSRPEASKSESVVQQTPQYPYVSAIPSYPSFGVMPQLMGGQYTYESPESQPQEVSRLPSFVSSYSDPGANYYSPVFRPSSDVDARYTHLISSNPVNKYNPAVTLMTGQGLSSTQEGGNSMVIPATVPMGQTSQTVGIAQTGLTIPQQPVPIHAYPAQHAGVPLAPFGGSILGFQYVPPSYGYMHTPYQLSYTGNTGYPQAPSVSSYGPAGPGPYAPTGATTIKYSLPHYKPGTGIGNAPHAAVAAGYGSFTSPAGFATVNSAATTATSGYDDVIGPQYKENNLYVPNQQQAEGSTVWIQTQPSRDMTGMQSNSFYNILGQGQHTGYAHAQPTHAVPAAAYANLYHHSQSGTVPTVHQLLQQPQGLGAVGGGGSTQSGAYQQPQRGQLNWTNNY